MQLPEAALKYYLTKYLQTADIQAQRIEIPIIGEMSIRTSNFELQQFNLTPREIRLNLLCDVKLQTVRALIPTSLHGRLTIDLSLQITVRPRGLIPVGKVLDLKWVQMPELQFGRLELGWESLLSGLLKTTKPRLEEKLNFELDRLSQPTFMSQRLTDQLPSFDHEMLGFQLREVFFIIRQIRFSKSELQLTAILELTLNVPSDLSLDTPPKVTINVDPDDVDQAEDKVEVTIASSEVSLLANRFSKEINGMLDGLTFTDFELNLNTQWPSCYLTLEKPAHLPVEIHWDLDYLSSEESIIIKAVRIEAGSGASLLARGALALFRSVIQNQVVKRSPIALDSMREDVQKRMLALTAPVNWNGNLKLVDLLTWKGKIEISCLKEGEWTLSPPNFSVT